MQNTKWRKGSRKKRKKGKSKLVWRMQITSLANKLARLLLRFDLNRPREIFFFFKYRRLRIYTPEALTSFTIELKWYFMSVSCYRSAVLTYFSLNGFPAGKRRNPSDDKSLKEMVKSGFEFRTMPNRTSYRFHHQIWQEFSELPKLTGKTVL